MNWLSNLVKKKPIESELNIKKDIPDNLWDKCPNCNIVVFKKDIIKKLYTCINCDYHFTMSCQERAKLLLDKDNYIELNLPKGIDDPIGFKTEEKYIDKLKSTRNKTGLKDSLSSFYGKINNNFTVLSIMNFNFMGGSMGTYLGEGFVYSVNYAIQKKCPFVIVTASGGARMHEGIYSLMQMIKTTVILERLKSANLPYIVILANPTTGGVTASFAMLGDIHIAEKGATIGFAGARVIEKTIRKKLPENAQKAEYLLEKGMIDIVCHRSDLKNKLSNILSILMQNFI
jgi:acetyl-CoA carboxylase carboxyl transferase subunit beta